MAMGSPLRHIDAVDPRPMTIDALLLNTATTDAFKQAVDRVTTLLIGQLRQTSRPFSGVEPAQLAASFARTDLERPLHDLEDGLRELETLYLRDAVYFHHPRYMAHLNCPVAYPAVAAELIAAAINSSVDTWDQSAGATHIEQSLIDWTARRIGFPTDTADGVFTSGGTQSNLMAMLLARDNYCLSRLHGHSVQRHGLPACAGGFRILASRVSHFSVQKAASVLGLGAEAVVAVDCDDHYCMSPTALESAIARCRQAGHEPIAVVATLGTTNFGSLDPIARLAPICRRERIWLHADAAYGCGLLISPRHRRLLDGIELADSVTVDYHKSFLQPVSCSALVVRDRRHLACVAYHADYLNPASQNRDKIPNLVSKSLQTTRRFDALKLWLTLRVAGPQRLGEAFDAVLELAQSAYRALAEDADYEVLHRPALSTLMFRYKPAGLRNPGLLDALNAAIRKSVRRDGRAMIASAREAGRLYLKLTLLNPTATAEDVRAVLEVIRGHGEDCRHALHPAVTHRRRAN